MKNCLLIINPCSGRLKMQSELMDVIKILNENNYETTVKITLYHNHAREIAASAHNYDIVICSGGDGTLNQVVSGLIDAGLTVPVGYIPSGSTNDFATTLGLSFDIKTAVQNIIDGEVHRIDVGMFGREYFNYVASFGVFTAASYSTPQDFKNMFGNIAYLFSGLVDLANLRPYHVAARCNGLEFEGEYILGLVTNTTSIAGIVKMDSIDVDLSDGMFEVILVKKPKDLVQLNKILNGFVTCKFDDDVFDFIRTSYIQFDFEGEVSWSLDGEEKRIDRFVTIENLREMMRLVK